MSSETESRKIISRIADPLCRVILLAATLVYTADALLPADLSIITGWLGTLVLVSGAPLVKKAYRRPALIFIAVSLFLILLEGIHPAIILDGANSLLSIVAIMTALQVFLIPIRAGRYDETLEHYLKGRFTSEIKLYSFISFITHVIGSFMLFSTVPMLYTLFEKPVSKMVKNPGRFFVASIGRSFSLVPLWAPGAVSVVLVMESTGAEWSKVLPAAIVLTIIGFITSILLEGATELKGRRIVSAETNCNIPTDGTLKIFILVIIAFVLLFGIMALDLLDLLSGSARVIVVGLLTVAVWTAFHRKGARLRPAVGEYWNKSLRVVPDLAVLFLSMGIFTIVIQETSFMNILRDWVLSISGVMGPFCFLMITPVIVLISLVGIHPLMGVAVLGALLSSVLPDQTTMIALGLLLGSAVAYSVSPFTGTLLTLSRFAGCSPAKAAFSWNGLFSLLFLSEGLILLVVMTVFSFP